MPRLSSPDEAIDRILASSTQCQVALQAYLDEGKWKTLRILPHFWQKFLDSSHGQPWRDAQRPAETQPVPSRPACYQCHTPLRLKEVGPLCDACVGVARPEPDDIPDPVVPLTVLEPPIPQTNGVPPLQSDLFDLLAQGLQDRLKPANGKLDEARVQTLIQNALATHSRYSLIIRKPDETQHVPLDVPLPYWFERTYKQALCRVHTLLVGPRGSGKTMTAELLAKALNLPLYTISLSGGVSEGVLQGWLHPSQEGLRFEYNRSRFVRAYQEGGVVLLDELDAADANMLMIANAALANGRWEIPLRGESAEPLIRHENFICLAAANTHGHGADRVYVGRNQLDGATLDRFAVGRISVDYDERLERDTFDPEMVIFGQRLRARCRAQHGWTRDVSTRNIADATKKLQQFRPEECWYGFFEDWKEEDCQKVGAVRDRELWNVTLE